MESSMSHCFNITGWRKYVHQRIKFSTVVKLLCISIHIPNFSSDFQKFQFFNGQNGQEGGTASLCQILSKSFEPRPRYVSFNIMLVWLENAYSRPFWGLLGHISQMMSLIVLTSKRPSFG